VSSLHKLSDANRYRHTDQYGDMEGGKKAGIYNRRCEIEDKRPESEHKKPSRGEIGSLLLGIFRKLKVNFFREIVPLPTCSYIPKGGDKE